MNGAYIGSRDEHGLAVVLVERNGEVECNLPHVVYHSPTGFEWGYGGSGPADLALSIVAHALGERPSRAEVRSGRFECGPCRSSGFVSDGVSGWVHCSDCGGKGGCALLCWKLHQRFKSQVVAQLNRQEDWRLEMDEVRNWIRGQLDEMISDQEDENAQHEMV